MHTTISSQCFPALCSHCNLQPCPRSLQSGQQQKEWKKYCIPCQQAAAADAPPGGEQKCWAGWDGKLESELSKLGTAEALVMCCNKNFLLEHLRVPFAMPVGSSAKQFQEAQASLKSQYGCGDASIARVVNDPVITHSRTYISCADPSQVGILCGASRG